MVPAAGHFAVVLRRASAVDGSRVQLLHHGLANLPGTQVMTRVSLVAPS
jgi:hypothetical protein